MKTVLYYDFDDILIDGNETIHVKCKNFKCEVDLTEEQLSMPLEYLEDYFREKALMKAACLQMNEYSDLISSTF